MSEQSQKKLSSQIIFENLRELLKAKNAAHDSMFKLHWKKMWPFCLIWPQVDYERIMRLMNEICKNTDAQKKLVTEAFVNAKDFEITFLKALPAYLDALDVSCKCLANAAKWKQEMLLKRIKKDVKLRRDVHEYNEILKAYEKAQGNLVRAGAFVQVGWLEISQKIAASQNN